MGTLPTAKLIRVIGCYLSTARMLCWAVKSDIEDPSQGGADDGDPTPDFDLRRKASRSGSTARKITGGSSRSRQSVGVDSSFRYDRTRPAEVARPLRDLMRI
jgi:hypothetical protein